jgi:hypothetical protein
VLVKLLDDYILLIINLLIFYTMNQIFEVCKTVDRCDSDMWQHWIEEERVSLHMTLAGAEKRVQELRDKAIANIPAIKKLNPHIPEKYWLQEEKSYHNNMNDWPIGDNGHGREDAPYFSIHTIPVED